MSITLSHYLYTDESQHPPGSRAVLVSAVLPPTLPGGNCFTFYYHMFGPTVGTLKVYTVTGSSRQLRGSFTGTMGNKWNLAQYTIKSQSDYQIQIESTTKGTYAGDISIDSINMDNVNCANSSLAHHSTDISCTFESGLCGWSQDHTDNFNWMTARGSNSSGITTDHTTNTASGHFLFMDASAPARQGWKARLISPQFPSSTGECLRFYMFMTGTPHATLSVYTRSASGTDSPVWTRTDNVQGKSWVLGEVTLTSQSKFQVIIEALRGSSSTSDIAVDDLTISPGPCKRAGACNFEQGLCGYTNMQGDQFDWTRGHGSSPSTYTGPTVDHTLGTTNGHYMFIESSSPQRPGDKAWLLSDPIQPTTGSCLTFWYNMNGAGIGTLNVYYVNNTNNQLFTMSGNHGNVWMKGNVTLVSTQPFKIMFEAIRGQNYRGDIAIDDIDVAPGYCSLQTTVSPVTTPQPTQATVLSCNFESNLCNWVQDRTDTFDWTRGRSGTSSTGTGPQFDHTLQNRNGYYIYIEASGKRANSTARLISPTLATSGQLCVQFWYNMYGQHINKLNLYTKSNNVLSSVLWTKAGNQGNKWIQGQVGITTSPGSQVVFEGTSGLGYQGDISLDDIKILSGACTGSASCDFEQSSICGYQQDLNDNFDWTWGHGSTGSTGTGPTNDHTYGTSAGHYMYTETSSPRVQGDKANLRSPSYPAAQQKCLTFWYHMYGQDIGNLNIYISTFNRLGSAVWTLYGNQGNSWHKGQVTISSRSTYQVVFSGIRGSGYHGDIAIDDIAMNDGACAGPGSCDFEKDLCSWTQRQDDSFDWIRRKGPTPSVGTGPSSDHTLGTSAGYYLFIETSRPRHLGDNAVIQSQLIQNQPQLCFSFWYNMHGRSVGSLNISMQIKSSSKTLKKSIVGDQGTGWKQGQVNMGGAYDVFTIFVEAGVGSGYQGDIAIDDLRLDPTSCGGASSQTNGTFNCTGGQGTSKVIPLNKVCNFMVDCPYASDETNCGACSFDQDFCSWQPNLQGVFTWKRGNKNTSANTGPSFDHTQGNQYGYYAYVDTTLGTSRSIATLTGPLLQPCSSTCQIQFWYSMYGRGIGTLSVIITEGGQNTTIWVQRGNQGNQWNKATVDIGRVGRPFQLLFKATRTYTNLGNIAVDDIQLINCNFPAVQKTCPVNQFQCTRGACVPKTDLCDFTDDCGDSSDEQSCSSYPARCDFETSLCSWTQDQTDTFDWTRATDHTASYGTGPSRDHTRGTAAGYYMYIESSRPRKPGDKARLLSPAFNGVVTSTTGQSQTCTLRLYYHMFGRTIGALNVYTRTAVGGPMKIIWQKAGNVGDFFERVDIPIFETNPFQVVIEGVTGQGYQGDIAIDDLSMTPGCKLTNTPLVTGTPGPVTTPGPCGNGSFSCSGNCINQNQVCDFIPQCLDKSDEANCGTCTFETNQCGWSDISSGRYNWHRFQGASPGTGGPSSDHTTNSANGHYMLVEGASGTFFSRARMTTVTLGPTAPSCQVQFYYHMYGIAAGNIQLSVTNANKATDSTVIWYKTGNQGNGWKQATADIGALPAGYKLQFDALPSKSFQASGIPQSDMAIDDVKFVACNPTQIVNNTVFNLNCTFESGLCGYFQETADDFDWTLTNQSSPTIGTGPDRDHTTGTGFYIYIETSSPRHAGQKARITSGIQKPTPPPGMCLTFWYHMFGAHVNTLNVYMQHPQSTNLTQIWSRSKTQGNVWRKGQRTLNSNMPFQIVFEGLVGVSWQGDIALDDISVINGPCPAPGVCDFEADFCGWTQDTTDDYDWTRDRNGTASKGTGPTYDHTTESQSGYYIYTEASSPLVMGNKARLISPNFKPQGSLECLHFWYHMFGQNVGTFNVYVQPSSGSAKSTIFSRTGNQVNLWLYATVQLAQTIDYHIILEGVRGNGYQGDIAVDDIRITPGKCKPVGMCDFELDTCGYGNTRTGDQFDWLRSAGGTLTRNTGPSVDHTTNSDRGFYMLVRANGRRPGDRAWLYSQYFPASPASCLSFWYHMYGRDVGVLRVYQPTSNGTLLVWNATHNQGNVWRHAKVDLSSPVSFQVTFDGQIGTGYQGDMALDDIALYQGHCSDLTTTVPTTAVVSTVTYPPSVYDCNFEQLSFCTWTQDQTDVFDWQIRKGHTITFDTGPTADHTTGSANGYYAYIESSYRHNNDSARLISQNMVLMTSGKCFKFWYHMYGADVYKLNVYAKQGGQIGNAIWTKIGYQGNYWKFASIYLTPETLSTPSPQANIQVVIEGVVGKGYRGDIAIDDISVNDGPCPTSSTCDFQSFDICQYSQDKTDNFDWVRRSGASGSTRTGPQADHTYGTSEGFYMDMLSSTPGVKTGDKARLLSPTYPATTGQCLTMYYFMNGRGVGSLAIRLLSQGQLKPALWTRSLSQGNMWRVAQITINNDSPFQIAFEATRRQQDGDIAIDDISVRNGPCAGPADCNFESDLCAWSNVKGSADDFDWLRNKGDTTSTQTGPSVDHTLGTREGWYVYMESSAPQKNGDKTRLTSSLLRATRASCFSFWYFMHGKQMGSLNLYLDTYSSHTRIFSLSGDQGSSWRQAFVNVTSLRYYSLSLEGVVGTGVSGDIALDDLKLTTGACSPASVTNQPFYCGNQQIAANKVCDFITDCSDGLDEKLCGNCTFEQNLCGWSDNSMGSYRWTVQQNGTETANTGPSSDHTLGTPRGHYIYVDASSGKVNSRAYFTSPTLQRSAATCQVSFYYHMYGSGIGTLSVDLNINGRRTMLWQTTGNHGNQWIQQTVNIGHISAPFQVEFGAIRRFSVIGDVAIDDVSMINCALPPVQASCDPVKQFRCTRGACVDKTQVCDYTDDCGDGSDESLTLCKNTTSRCSFDTNTCDWRQDKQDDFDWTIHRSRYPISTATGPTFDHTTGTATGGYMYIRTFYPRRQNDNAVLMSPVWQSSPNCFFTFYFNMNGRNMGSLNVYLRDSSNNLAKIWSRSGNRGNIWEKAVIHVQGSSDLQVLMEGVTGRGNFGVIGIDDTVFSSGCQKSRQTFATGVTIPPTVPTVSPCGGGMFQCTKDKSCITQAKVCDFSPDCSDGSDEGFCGPCNFETGNCGWLDISTGKYNWTVHSGADNSPSGTGPSVDHTLNTTHGHYAYVEGTRGVFYSKAILQSPVLTRTSASCEVHFWYSMYGSSIGTLIVSAIVNNTERVLTTIRGSQGIGWHRGSTYLGRMLGATNNGTVIRFQVLPARGFSASNTADIAIDDITFDNCKPNAVLPNISCTFDSNLCAWTQALDDDFNWSRHNGSTSSVGTGPTSDHTTGHGSYIYIETSRPRQRGQVAILDSPSLPPTDSQGHCLSFWYYMFGPTIGSLDIYLTTRTNRTLFWSRNGTQSDAWMQAQRQIISPTDYHLSVYGYVGNGYQGDIALDDFGVTAGPCPPSRGCNFENGFCGWTQLVTDEFDWSIGSNGTASRGTGPRFDHTFGSNSGHFAFIESSAPRRQNDRAIIKSPLYTGTTNRCLRFWYTMYGQGIGSLNIYTQTNGSFPRQVWTRTGDQGNKWRQGTVTLSANNHGQSYSVLIEGVRGSSYTGDIAIDDLYIADGSCPPLGYCNFEQDMCGWTNAVTVDDFDWLRDNGGTTSRGTGPSVDHTTGTSSGHYMYIETSGRGRGRLTAWLVSDIFTPTSAGSCLKFWYHMYGSGIGSLNVYTQAIGTRTKSLQWTLSGNQGNVWKQATVAIPGIFKNFNVIFEGVYNGSYLGDIAIDDTSYAPIPCGGQVFTTAPSPTVSSSPSAYPSTPLDCNFEHGICNWQQDHTDNFDWSLHRGATSSASTGPATDHTLRNTNGQYAYIEVSGKHNNDKARLLSPMLNIGSHGMCLKFWYNMYGANVNRLNIYTNSSGTASLVWTRYGDQGIGWKYSQIHIANTGTSVLEFEGVAGIRYAGDIALDDITVNTGLCPQDGTCDFENGLCGYVQSVSDVFDWTLHSGHTSSVNTGPQTDHTFGTNEGHYMYIESSRPRRPGDKARLDTPKFSKTTASCFQFWYNMNGRTTGRLNVYQRAVTTSNLGQPIWKRSGPQGPQWYFAQVTVRSQTDFFLTFEGVVGSSYYSDIAIDDITMTTGSCPPPGSCDFEKGFCTWFNNKVNDTFDWQRNQGPTGSSGTGPTVDHTLNSRYGTYLYIEASSPRQENDNAYLMSQMFTPEQRCIQFYYNMYGAYMGTLNLWLWPNGGQANRNLWTMMGNQGNAWKQVQIQIPTAPLSYRLVFEGIVGIGVTSDMAIDDIMVVSGLCSQIPAPTSVVTCVFHCKNNPNKCISNTQVCDFNNDCTDGSDEATCGYSCDFETKGACKWTNGTRSQAGMLIWKRQHAQALSSNAGPANDHTTLGPNGYYLYVKAAPGQRYYQANLISPILGQASSTCQLSFWYHMYGSTSESLTVYMAEDSSTFRTRLWNIAGDHGNKWNQAIVPIGRIKNRFSMSITAQRPSNNIGDIAIDDLQFQGCSLPSVTTSCNNFNPFRCTRGSCVSSNRVCDFTDDCGDNTDETTCTGYNRCNFEHGICDWTQLTDDDFDWSLRSGSTPSRNTGPAKDHTLNTASGHYLYIESSRPRTPGQKARIASRFFTGTPNAPLCVMRFYYFMFGQTVDTLAVYMRSKVNGPLTPLFSQQGQVGEYYARREVAIQTSSPFQIVIEATVGSSYLSDIAIDDVSFSKECVPFSGAVPTGTPGSSVGTTVGPCGAGRWQCYANKKCIQANQRCDFVDSCGDGSDEAQCGACTFEKSTCGWSDLSTGRFMWQRHNASTPSLIQAPPADHTYGSSGVGNYMFVSSGKGSSYGNVELASPSSYGNLADTCHITLYYYKNSDSGSVLKLYLVPPTVLPNAQTGRILLWAIYGNHGSEWNLATIGIGRRTPGYSLVFEAEYRNSGTIAIDDINFTGCALGGNSTCASNQFSCQRGSCVDQSLVCDFNDDCGDDSDEQQCSKYVQRCNFESDLCNWYQDDTDDFQWTWKQGKTATARTGPTTDHTYGNPTGHYFYIETSSPRRLGDKARLKSVVFSPNTQSTCRIRFFYFMHGVDVNTLNVYTEGFESGPLNLIWSKNGSQPDQWMRADIPLTSPSAFRVVIEGVRGTSYHGDIAIDDVSFTPSCQTTQYATLPFIQTTVGPCGSGKRQCNNGQCVPWSAFCDFKSDCTDGSDEASCPWLCDFDTGDFCHWTNDHMSDFNWTLGANMNPTSSSNPGPRIDHTRGTTAGSYAIAEVSHNIPNSVARLDSPIYHQSGKNCVFSMWFQINGGNFRSFTVFLSSRGKESQLWSMDSRALQAMTNGTWSQIQTKLPQCASDFKILMEVRTYGRKPGYIAVDDLQFTGCSYPAPASSCLLGQFTCGSGHCVPQNLKCDYQLDCCDGTDESAQTCDGYEKCDFELNTCNWQQMTNDQFDWQRHRGKTSSFLTGPSQDHTTGTTSGYYMYIESSSPQKAGDTARLGYFLPVPTSPCSLRFWYLMYGQDVGALNVYMNSIGGGGLVLLDNITSDQGNVWRRLEVSLTSTTPYEVIIEGVVGVGYHGDIAIDDISFTPGCGATHTIQPTPSVNPCPNNGFQCGDKTCIDSAKVCNFQVDCSDGSDENSCTSSCQFEQGMCKWTETSPDTFDWTRGSGGTTNAIRTMAPSTDANYQNQNGYYVFIKDGTHGHPVGKTAQLSSPTYVSSNAQCLIQFSYYMNGDSPGTLYLYLIENNLRVTLWHQTKAQGDQWNTVTVGVGRHANSFNFVFSKKTSSYSGVTALDNIQFLNCRMKPPVQTCPNSQTTHFWCQNKVCISRNNLCDLTDNCGDRSDEQSCASYKQYSFESGGIQDLIQGVNSVDDDFDWLLWNGSSPSMYTGPLWDHTTGNQNGHYLYMESSNRKYNQKTWLLTKPFYRTNAHKCQLRFYFYMYGQYVNQLNVYYRVYNSGPPTKTLFTRSGDQGAYWQRVNLHINVTQSFQIIFEAKVGDTFLGDIAIDDLSFTPDCQYAGEGLPNPPQTPGITTHTPPVTVPHACNAATQFNCHSDGHCIDKTSVCDFKADCNDTSDEANCPSIYCDFDEGNLCGWMINTTSTGVPDQNYKWKLDQGSTISTGDLRPANDQTAGTTTGGYVWADSSPGSYHDTTELYTPMIGKTGPQCTFSFYYWMQGPSVNALDVYTLSDNQQNHLFTIEGDHGAKWNLINVFIGAKSNYQLVIQARRGRSFRNDISLDSLQFLDCRPPAQAPSGCPPQMFSCSNGYCIDPDKQCDYADDCGDGSDEVVVHCDQIYKARCNFENGICPQWSNEITDNFNWTLSTSNTQTIGTGPLTDHTLRSSKGTYLYIESSSPRKQGDQAQLASVVIKGVSQNCRLRLWYHMWGQDIGALTILKRYGYNQGSPQLITMLSGDKGDFWYILEAVVSNEQSDTRNFEIIIQGTVGAGYHGDIAIDDISLTPGCELANTVLPGTPTAPPPVSGSCGTDRYACTNGNCYGPAETCNFIDDCGDNTDEVSCGTGCTFETGASMCGWKNSEQDNADWLLHTGQTPSKQTGPLNDHTTNKPTGHYLYLESSSPSHPGEKTILESSEYYESGPACNMSFWYNMKGRDIGSLSVLVKLSVGPIQTLWTMTGDQGPNWKLVSIPLTSYHKFIIMIKGVRGNGYLGDIAIDDITFNNCQPTVEVKTCPDNQFRCKSGTQCIQERYRCDEHTDCNDGSDEDDCRKNYGDCNFDQTTPVTTCSWTQLQDDDSDWLQGPLVTGYSTGTNVDHRNTANGRFMLMDNYNMRPGDTARLQTPVFSASRGLCYVRFWYYMYGSPNLGSLRLFTQNANEKNNQLFWSMSGSQGNQWKYANVLLGGGKNFSVIFEATRGAEPQSEVLLDDVSFTPECATGKPAASPSGLNCDVDSFECAPVKQCYPNSWRCDGVADCPDRSDEPFFCPTSPAPTGSTSKPSGPPKTTPKPAPKTLAPTSQKPSTHGPIASTCTDTQKSCKNGNCINKLYFCDGVADCADASDEVNCLTCHKGYYYCLKQRQCINSTRCDSIDDCGDMTDESICGTACPPNFCQNNGVCNAATTNIPGCSCSGNFYGDRCQYVAKGSTAPHTQTRSKSSSSKKVGIGLGVTAAILVVVAAVLGGYFYRKKRNERLALPGIVNQIYEESSNDIHDFSMNEVEPSFNDSNLGGKYGTQRMTMDGGASIENPLYQDAC